MKPTSKSARRGAFALGAIVAVTLLSTTTVLASDRFSDVPDDHPFHDDITWAVDNGIAEGFPDGTYHPGQAVSRGAMAAFSHRLFDRLFPQKVDRSFHVFVVCAASTRFAVVAASGTFVRGSAGTTSSQLTDGTYVVTFNTNVSACSWQVTVGQTGSVGTTTGWANVAGRSGNVNGLFITTQDVVSG